jgi:cation diffusion facilitator family transporter
VEGPETGCLGIECPVRSRPKYHAPVPSSGNQPKYRDAVHITRLSLFANVVMGILKVLVGWLANSRALIADGLHSLTDLGSDLAILIGIRFATEPPDESHPYGHHKIASVVSLFIAGLILLFCSALIVDSVRAMVTDQARVPHWPALVVAVGSVLVKEWLFYRTRTVARDSHSSMVLANAWHHRTDSVTSIVAAIGIAAAIWLGDAWAFLDAAVGILLGGYLAMEGAKLLLNAIKDLMDTAPQQHVIDDLREHILPIPGVVGYHDFRARRVGDMIEVDLHLLVPPELTVREGHDIAARVKHEILERHPEVINVLIHIEPALPEHKHERGVAELR